MDGYWSLFGVHLANDMHLNDRSFDTCLGIIVLGSDWSSLMLPAIRLTICHQLHTVLNSFSFLTSEGFVQQWYYVSLVCLCIVQTTESEQC